MRVLSDQASPDQPSQGSSPGVAALSPDSVLLQLKRIVASQSFVHSPQLCRFLRFVVEQEIGGQGDHLKEYALGVEVFRKDASFDPRIDTVVRTEARRLRHKLTEYYQTEGQSDAIEIDLPKGGYRPVLRSRQVAPVPRPKPSPVSRNPKMLLAAGTLLAIAGAAAYWLWRLPRDADAGQGNRQTSTRSRSAEVNRTYTSIAVLPFADMSPQRDQEYFCDGLTEELINSFAKLDGLHVVARTSVFAFKGKPEDIRKIGAQLNVQTVLEGSVRKAGDHLRITAQLNSVPDGYRLWTETYDRDLKDVFAIQEEISRAVVEALKLKLRGGTKQAFVRPYSNLKAYNLYLLGRYYFAKRPGEVPLNEAIGYLDQALREDPNFALAYSGLADCYTQLALWDHRPPLEVMPKAMANASKALEIDDSLAEAHVSRAVVRALYEYRPKEALAEFERATVLNPGYAAAHWAYAMYLESAGQSERAMHELKQARELDPLSIGMGSDMARFLFERGDHDRAIEQLRQMLDMDPTSLRVQLSLGEALQRTGRHAEAISILEKAHAASADYPRVLGSLGLAYGVGGRPRDARKTLDRLTALRKQRYVPAYDVAIVYMGLGERERTFEWLEKAYEERHAWLMLWRRSHLFDDLRSDPRFGSLMKRMGWENSSDAPH